MLAARTQPSIFDIVVYGATPGGIACALRAAREGLTTLLVNHTLQFVCARTIIGGQSDFALALLV